MLSGPMVEHGDGSVTPSVVPRKRDARDEIQLADGDSILSSREGVDGNDESGFVSRGVCWKRRRDLEDARDEDLEEAYDSATEESLKEEALKEEALGEDALQKDAVRTKSELDAHDDADSKMQREFDEHGYLFRELDEEDYYGFYTEDDLENFDQAYTASLKQDLEEEALREEALRAEALYEAENREAEYGSTLEDRRGFYEDQYLFEEFCYNQAKSYNDIYLEDRPQRTMEDTFFKERIQSDRGEILDPGFQTGLCRRCCSVRWSRLAHMSLKERHLVYALQESPLKLLDSTCNICQFLGRIGLRTSSQAKSRDGTIDFELRIGRSQRDSTRVLFAHINGEREGSLITVHSTAHNGQWKPPIINLESINYDSLRQMISQCRHGHADTCRPKRGVELPGFRVIDCVSRRVVPAGSKCKYVALSYVWGKASFDQEEALSDTSFPATVEDALRVTVEMKFRYLWVDRYCIDQGNAAEKHKLIQNMDQIYTNAQLTIIAAAGDDPTYGLPGVGAKPRSLQDQVRIGNTKLVRSMRPGSDFPKSSWWERAWTYQEGVLSKRKLVFTDHQVFYVCNTTSLSESLHLNPKSAVDDEMSLLFDSPSFSEMVFPTGFRNHESYLKDISRRALSHESDALNACLGILKATNTTHVWGVPIESKSFIALCWRHKVPTNRRLGFPSWSWAGWQGGARFYNSIVVNPFCTILLGDEHGDWQTLREYVSSGRAEEVAGKQNAPKLLKMTGPALSASWLNDQWPDVEDFGIGTTDLQDDQSKPCFRLDFDGLSAQATLCLDQEMTDTEQLRDVMAMGVRIR